MRARQGIAIAALTVAGAFGGHAVADTFPTSETVVEQQQDINTCAQHLGNVAVFSDALPEGCDGFVFLQDPRSKENYLPSSQDFVRLQEVVNYSADDTFDSRSMTVAGSLVGLLIGVEASIIIANRRRRKAASASI